MADDPVEADSGKAQLLDTPAISRQPQWQGQCAEAGSLQVGEHQGLAWVEMARGLLIHQVHLDSAAPDACVLGCRVLAPTDWDFHPLGPVAQVLETLPKTITIQGLCRVVNLMTAYDPCVRFNLPKLMTPAETSYA